MGTVLQLPLSPAWKVHDFRNSSIVATELLTLKYRQCDAHDTESKVPCVENPELSNIPVFTTGINKNNYSHIYASPTAKNSRARQELCESRGGRPTNPYGLFGLKAALNTRNPFQILHLWFI